MGIVRLGLILWLAPVILLVALRLVPFAPMATFIAFAYAFGVLIGDIKLVNLNKWAVVPELIVEHAEIMLVGTFVAVVTIGYRLC